MRGRSRSHSENQIHQDFLDSIERLKLGRPQNKKLREKIKKGKVVKINISNVALEAGRARSLIARDDCAYPEIRMLIQMEMGDVPSPARTLEDVISSLRLQLAETKTDLKKVTEHSADHYDKRCKAEKKAAAAAVEITRLNNKINKLKKQVKGGSNTLSLVE